MNIVDDHADERPLSVGQVANLLGISKQSVRRIPAAALPFFRVMDGGRAGGDRRYRRQDIDAYIEKRTVRE